MTESPQQPGYSAAPQQPPAGYPAQQQTGYAPQQAYVKPAPNVFDSLPMNIQTLGLAAGGALLLLLGSLIMGAENLNIPAMVSGNGGFALLGLFGIIALTGVAITTGPKYRNTYRAIVSGLTALEVGTVISLFLNDDNPDEGALIIGIILYIFAIGCLAAATFTMAEKPAVDPQVAAMQQAQQQAAQQAAAQQAAQQQYQANQAAAQQTGEQPTTWQQPQQPPQQ